MNANRFDLFTRHLGHTTARRRLIAGLALSPLAGLVARPAADADATPKHTKPGQKPQPNAFGCLDVGQPCAGADGKCCSGVCQGKKPKKGKRDKSRCVAHDASTCQAGSHSDSCGGSVDDVCVTSTGNTNGVCNTTTGKAGYCHASTACFACGSDVDCKPVCGARAACVTCTACTGTGGTMCASPDASGCPSSM